MLTGGGHTVLLQHPHRIPRVLGRAQCGLDVLRGQEMYEALGLLFVGDVTYVSHGVAPP